MSYISTCAKLNMASKKMGHKCHTSKPIDRSYSNFAGSNVLPMSKESLKKALPDKYKTMSTW
jgi:hypothetical protein